ncbi:uncharacterized protein EV154DRAFT_554491 [Mucor mucedo]|uniref:uncharacterized protein n=1 Tax=Mucor mucedo TaxID=29922 RepID=UPI0022208643|nr:uncharacterized protein EV154DRAFT_554491 [Mucor mucedo]KAI7887681.1 hypothetical protein EV154DRAFT_554491 [Mucor mucedo]
MDAYYKLDTLKKEYIQKKIYAEDNKYSRNFKKFKGEYKKIHNIYEPKLREFCKLHTIEEQRPLIVKYFCESFTFESLANRSKNLVKNGAIDRLLSGEFRSQFEYSKSDIEAAGGPAKYKLLNLFYANKHRIMPGYYGQIGFEIISKAAIYKFSHEAYKGSSAQKKTGLSHQQYLTTVIVPEIACWIIAEDQAYSHVPTRLAYLNGKLFKWGAFGIVLKDAKTVSLFKLHLDETKKGLIPELPYGLEIEQAISDYLRSIFEHTCTFLSRRIGKEIDTNKLRFCLPVPDGWTEKARNTMRNAVIRAGIISKEDPEDRLLLVSESEAIALYCETFLVEYNLKPGQNFLICDAGRFNVNVVVYRKTVDNNGKNSLMEEVAGDSVISGYTTLDPHFRNFVSDNVNLFFKNVKPLTDRELDNIVDIFTNDIKPRVCHPSNPHYDKDYIIIPLPERFDETEYDEEDKLFVADSQLHMHPELMLSEIFDPVINQVLSLIDTQLKRIDRKLDAIFLVGEFGQSTYLLHKIKDKFSTEVILICAPHRGEMAVVRGAVLMGLNPQFVKQRIIRRTYGYECSLEFDKSLDPEGLRAVDQNGEVYCNNRFRSYVLKGEIRDVDYYVDISFKCYYSKNPVLKLYAYDGNPDHLPRFTTDDATKKVTEFEIKLPNLPGKGPNDTVVIDAKLYLYQTEIKLEVEIENIKKIYTGSHKKVDNMPFIGEIR